MYSVILMTAMTASAPDMASFGLRRRAACWGGACVGCSGCWGACYGYASCWGCRGGCWGSCYGYGFGWAGCSGSACNGVGCYGVYAVPVAPAAPAASGTVPMKVGYRPAGHAGWFGLYHGTYDMNSGPLLVARDVWGANYRYSGPAPFVPAVPAANNADEPKVETDTKLNGSARLILEVPADAKLFIDGQQMKSTAEMRHFYTPKLASGQTYFYEVRVETQRGGEPLVETKRVYVRANEVIRQSFKTVGESTAIASK